LKFVIENWGLIAIAVASGALLLWPVVQRRTSGPALDTLSATRLINDGAVVLDVRANTEFSTGHLPNARNIPEANLGQRLGELPASKPVLVVCATGQRSGKAAGVLRKAGRDQIFSLAGGLGAWRQAGLPVVR
jgi:rhodanese-related sulfurtransferase